MRDLLLQFNYVHTCQSCLGMSIIITRKLKNIKNERRCRDSMTKNDTNKRGYKSEGKYTKPYPPLHLITLQFHFSVRKMQGWVYLPSLLYPPLFVSFFVMPSLHLLSFLMFMYLFVFFSIPLIFSDVNTISSK